MNAQERKILSSYHRMLFRIVFPNSGMGIEQWNHVPDGQGIENIVSAIASAYQMEDSAIYGDIERMTIICNGADDDFQSALLKFGIDVS